MSYTIESVDMDNEDLRDEMNQLDRKCFPDEQLCDKHGHWWVARDTNTNKLVGFAGLQRSEQFTTCGYLCRAGVVPAHRGLGIQSQLIRVRLRRARHLGWDWVLTDTRDNPWSSNNLIAAGFRMYAPTQPWGDEHASYWQIQL